MKGEVIELQQRERSGSSDTAQKQEIQSDVYPGIESEARAGLSINNSAGFSARNEIEPEDNFEQGSSAEDYDTELDTDELVGNHLNTSSNNNSFDHQERMLGSTLIPNQKHLKSDAKSGGGIKCLRNLRRKRASRKQKASERKPKQGFLQ